ncbi:hypothetical protein M124_3050 [Bacteroides fragilis str. 3988T(B)14]|uniref:Uncharacterized protein n=1 Tax=Bacteroides fragilis str. 3988T(B)14 TaxID=1339315 RepID=A0A015TRI0_BACFG|nr:hypothetical protein M117_3365 [Bacteroides fragilis str. 3774 T13]EXY73221.1 hypothetical protein M124_3050 [Bacteroides fragilis str. 3988T(B)14]EXY79134.1 hypothetical protein M084_3143 [Bacteroides fragilis str. 3988 T1]
MFFLLFEQRFPLKCSVRSKYTKKWDKMNKMNITLLKNRI